MDETGKKKIKEYIQLEIGLPVRKPRERKWRWK